MKALCTADEMRNLDAHAITQIGIPSMVLMENAGRGAAETIQNFVDGELNDKNITILVGGGNNGGDGLVVARIMHGWGARIHALLMSSEDRLSQDTRANLEILRRLEVPVNFAETESKLEEAAAHILDSDILIDALFGTGLSRPLLGHFARACTLAEESRALRVSLDLPSGINANDGSIMGCCFPADHCITFGALKWGQITPPGREFCSNLELIDIGIPTRSLQETHLSSWIPEHHDLTHLLPSRPLDAHKGSFGHALVLAGSDGKAGAAMLAGQAVLRSGAGLSTIGSDEPIAVHQTVAVVVDTVAILGTVRGGNRGIGRVAVLLIGDRVPVDVIVAGVLDLVPVEVRLPIVREAVAVVVHVVALLQGVRVDEGVVVVAIQVGLVTAQHRVVALGPTETLAHRAVAKRVNVRVPVVGGAGHGHVEVIAVVFIPEAVVVDVVVTGIPDVIPIEVGLREISVLRQFTYYLT